MTTFKFKNDSDKWAVINALDLAARKYDEYAGSMKGQHALTRQFEDQASIARRLMLEIEETE